MKQKTFNFSYYIFGICFLFSACDSFYFTSPQPVDSENIYEFPRKIRGAYSKNNDSVIFGKDYFKSIEYNEDQIPRHLADTSSSYILKNNKIYLVDNDEEIKLTEGFPYKLKDDTIFYKERTVFEIALGKKAFLRQVSNYYFLNVKKPNQWWEIYLIEFADNDSVYTRYLDSDDLDKISNLRTIHSQKNEYYLEAEWTNFDINEIIKNGGFSDTLLRFNTNERQPLKK